ncbi:MAG: hypothetical protein JWO13_779 [Acidobacteriales bacterium]|nr:hypothetical protein [Terriglobales bacterium]
MCLSDAATSHPDTQRSLRHGIVVLLVPSLGAMVGLITLAYKDRDHFDADEDDIL